MHVQSIGADTTANISEIRNGFHLKLAAGVDLTLPNAASWVDFTVTAEGAGCTVVAADGIDDAGQQGSTAAYALEAGETLHIRKGNPSDPYVIASMTAAGLARRGVHAPVRAATSGAAALPAATADANGVLTADANGALAVDGQSPVAGDRVLVNEGDAVSLIYTVTDAGDAGSPFILTPAFDSDSAADLPLGSLVVAYAGTANAGAYYLSAFDGDWGTDSLTWSAV